MMPGSALVAAAFFLSLLGTAVAIRFAASLGLVQEPNHRSSHDVPTPGGGGLGLVLGGLVSGLLLAFDAAPTVSWLLIVIAAAVLAAIGFRDDIKPLPTRLRFMVQIGVCALLLVALPVIPGLPLPGGMVLPGYWLAGPLLLAGIWWVNLFNFMDGIDGLAGSQALFMLATGTLLAFCQDPTASTQPSWLWGVAILFAVFAFLPFNWPPARIFMGDVGSTFLAFVILTLALMSVAAGWTVYATWLVLGALFISDATITLLQRMRAGEKWTQPHRSHAYQRLSRRWRGTGARKRGHYQVVRAALILNVFWLAPLAYATVLWRDWQWAFAALAYLPVIAMVIGAGAGKPDQDR